MKIALSISFCCLLLCPVQQVSSLAANQTVNAPHLTPPVIITKIIVKSVDYMMTTWGRIPCEKFEKTFPNANVTTVIDSSTLEVFARRIALFKPVEPKYNVDARTKMTIYYSDGTTASLCIGGIMEFNGKKVKYDSEVMKLLGLRGF